MARRTSKTPAPKFSERIRFNWGFHDATRDAEQESRMDPKSLTHRIVRDMATHFDAAYAAGYRAGVAAFKELGFRPESSEASWLVHSI
jgi:hypothetical protein